MAALMSFIKGWHICFLRLSLKKKLEYGNVMAWLRCRLSFSLLRSAIACLWGARSHRGCPANYGALDLALIEGQVCM